MGVVDRLITQAEERWVDQMLLITSRLADGKNTAEAEDGLWQIGELFHVMRTQRCVRQRFMPSP